MTPLSGETIDEESDEGTTDQAPSKRERLKKLGQQVKSMPKRLLMRVDVLTSTDTQLDDDGTVIEGVTDNPSFDIGMVMQKEHNALGGAILNTVEFAKEAALVIAHPRNHTKIKAAGKFTAAEHPYLTEDADRKLLAAHDELKKADRDDKIDPTASHDLEDRREKIMQLENERDAARNAWITGKHVKRVRVVPAKLIDYPKTENYREYNEAGQYVRWRGDRYIGHMLLYISQGFLANRVDDTNDLPFKRGTLKHHAERLLVASSIWQVWFMHIRKVYMWEQPLLSLQWLSCFFFLLKFGYIMTFAFLWIIYITVKNRVMGDNLRFLREAQERAFDQGATAQKLSELVNRHGNDQWVDAVLDELGPLLQQQLGDLADFLEILNNFYSWRDARATVYTLIFWLTCAFVAAVSSMEFGAKVLFGGLGLYFFFSRPIASLHPRYRKAVSSLRWIFWDVPTNAELAFQELRASAQEARAEIIRRKVDERFEKENKAATAAAKPDEISNRRSNSRRSNASSSQDYHAALPHQQSLPNSPPLDANADADANANADADEVTDTDTSTLSSTLDTDILADTDFLSFRARYKTYAGRLIITSTGLRFTRSLSPKNILRHASLLFRSQPPPSTSTTTDPSGTTSEELWSRPFSSIAGLRKARTGVLNVTKRKKILQTNALVISWIGDEEDMWFDSMRKRDEAFNCIIGFSGLRFQSLQPEVPGWREAGGEGIEGNDEGKGMVGGDKGKEGGEVFEEIGKV